MKPVSMVTNDLNKAQASSEAQSQVNSDSDKINNQVNSDDEGIKEQESSVPNVSSKAVSPLNLKSLKTRTLDKNTKVVSNADKLKSKPSENEGYDLHDTISKLHRTESTDESSGYIGKLKPKNLRDINQNRSTKDDK